MDADDTLFDFGECERMAVEGVIKKFKLGNLEGFTQQFQRVNNDLWKQFEQGAITSDEIVWKRFVILFEGYGVTEIDPHKAGKSYRYYLARESKMFDGALAMVQRLQKAHDIYCITNGSAYAQKKRIKSSKLGKYLTDVFISEKIGARKPQKEYFDFVLEHIHEKDKNNIFIIGDSLTADIAGGQTSNIKTIWYNRNCSPNTTLFRPTHTVKSMAELEELITKIALIRTKVCE